MVNTKKVKKPAAKDEIDSDAEVLTTQLSDNEAAEVTSSKPSKKDKNAKKAKKATTVESDADGVDSDLEELTKKVKSLKVKKSKAPKKAGFDLLMADMSDEDEAPAAVAAEPESEEEVAKPAKKADKKGKKAKRGKKDDEDIDQVLAEFSAELEVEYSGGKKAEVANDEAPAEQKKGKKGKKQVIVAEEAEAEPANEAAGDDVEVAGEGGTVKSAAQKKKEKKERQKREAADAKLKQLASGGGDDDEPSEAVVPAEKKGKAKKSKEVTELPEETAEPTGGDDAAGEDAEAVDKKGKNKKKTKAEREAEKEAAAAAKKKKGGVSAAMVAVMQERLAKVREEEERAKREEEERIQREEELENLRLEKIRIEAEKKEKKKQREAERRARLKAEGKLLTAKQKQDKERAEAMLAALRAQGVDLPQVGEDKPRPVRLGTRIRPNKKNAQESQSDLATSTEELKPEVIEAPVVPAEPVEKVKDSWDASSSEDEVEEPKIAVKAVGKKEAPKKKTKAESESDSDEEDDDDSDEDDSDEDDSDDDDSDEDSDDDQRTEAERRREKVWERITKRRHAAEEKRTTDNLRAAVVCVLGHVDTGKTKILDKLRRTNVQDGEAGGITQQIGATNVPIEAIKEQTRIVKGYADMKFRLPGLLIIDTPGHESFSNLRNRGSSLCDIAILVVDIMHGLEPQTIESINILKSKKVPFIVALNKIDRLYNWETAIRKDVREILKIQAANTQLEFQQRTKDVILQFAEQGLNAALYYENPDPRTYVNLVPTSAISGEGMGNLLFLIIESCQTLLAKRLMYSDELLATVLEVKAIPGLGTTIDAILINGKLREGDTICIAGTDGPIVTQIRSLLMPQPMKELRVKNAYIEYKEIVAAQGVKIAAKDLEKAIAGLNVYVANKPDEVDWCRDEVAKELKSALSHIKLSGEGVYVQASTLGSLEALLEFLRTSKIPYSNIRIGPVVKRDVMKASTMLVHDSQFATILAFDVKIERDAQEMADSLGVKIFQADIIYHLFDQFTNYREELKRKKREEFKHIAVFPCKLKILPQFIFNSRDPIVMGVMIEAGIVKEGTPICVPSQEFLDIGIVTSIECNHKQVESARKGQEVCIKIDPIPGESPKMFGRHFDEKDILTSKISRQSIDACKDYFRDDLVKADWALMVELKKLFEIL